MFHIHKDYGKVLTAEADIVCYKSHDVPESDGSIVSFHQKHVYVPGKNYTLNKTMQAAIGNPFKALNSHQWGTNLVIKEGFHSHIAVGAGPRLWVSEFVIPKGSQYYKNPNTHEYVSDQIRMVKVLGPGITVGIELKEVKTEEE